MKTAIIVGVALLTLTVLAPATTADPLPIIGDPETNGTCITIVPGDVPPVVIDPEACLPPGP